MPNPDPDVVEHHLRGLDADARAALVADLWAARGFETSREGDVVVATRRGRTTTLYALREPLVGSPSTPDRAVDAVVVPRRTRAATAVAAECGARVVDAADLRETLWYGVDRPVAVDLCERHLGAAPAALRPPLRERVRGRVRGANATVPVVAVLVLVVVAGLLVAPALTATPEEDAEPTGDADMAADPGPWPGPGAAATGPGAVPGMNESGIAEPRALATAHARAIEDRSYTVWYDYRGPHEDYPNETRVHLDIDMRAEGDRYTVVESMVRGDRGESRRLVRREYYDGSNWYIEQTRDGNKTYWAWSSYGGEPAFGPDPFSLRRGLAVYYLSTPETNVTGTVERDGERLYRVVGSGRPVAPSFDRVDDYRFVALVGQDGFIRSVTVQYVEVVDGERAPVRVEISYDRVDETTVTEPGWYERELGNATVAPADR